MNSNVFFAILLFAYYAAASQNLTSDEVQIGNSIYKIETIPNMETYLIERIGVNHDGDIYFWYGYIPYLLPKGASKPIPLDGIDNKIIGGFALDSQDNFFFCRTFLGLFILKKNATRELRLPSVNQKLDTVVTDPYDNLYIGTYNYVDKINLNEDKTDGESTPVKGFTNYGFRVPAAIDSKGGVYFRRAFDYFFYQNLEEGESSIIQIKEIGKESALCAEVDTQDNAYVATTEGLYFIKAKSKGKDVEKVKHFGNKYISTVHVDTKHNNTIYVNVKDEGLYKLTYGKQIGMKP